MAEQDNLPKEEVIEKPKVDLYKTVFSSPNATVDELMMAFNTNQELVLHDFDYYKSINDKIKTENPDIQDKDFESLYSYVNNLKTYIIENPSLVGPREKIFSGSDIFNTGIQGRGYERINTDKSQYDYIDPITNEFGSHINDLDKVLAKPKFYDGATGEWIDRPMTQQEKIDYKSGIFYDENSGEYYARIDNPDKDIYTIPGYRAFDNFEGTYDKYGITSLEGLYKGVYEVTAGIVRMPYTPMQILNEYLVKPIITDPILGLIDKDTKNEYNESVQGYFNENIDYLNKWRNIPSEEQINAKWNQDYAKILENVGQGIGSLAQMYIAGYGGSLLGMTSKSLATMTAGAGALQVMGPSYDASRAMGLSHQEALNMSMVDAATVFLSERLISADMLVRGLGDDAMKTLTKDVNKAKEYMQQNNININSIEGKQTFIKKAVEFIKGDSEYIKLSNPVLNKGKQIVEGFVREGLQEGTEAGGNALSRYVFNEAKKIYSTKKDLAEGKGLYSMYNTWDDINSSFWIGGLTGAIGNGIMGDVGRKRSESIDKIIDKDGIAGATKLIDHLTTLGSKGLLGSNELNIDGEPITIEKTNQQKYEVEYNIPWKNTNTNIVENQNEYLYDLYRRRINERLEDREEFKTSNPLIWNALTNESDEDNYVFKTLNVQRDIKKAKTKLNELTTSLSEAKTEEEKAKIEVEIDKVNEDLNGNKEAYLKLDQLQRKDVIFKRGLLNDYKNLTTIEKGTAFPAFINDRRKQLKVITETVKDSTDKYFEQQKEKITNEFRNSPKYLKEYNKRFAFVNQQLYLNTRDFDLEFNNYISKLNTKENIDALQIKRTNYNTKLTEFNPIINTKGTTKETTNELDRLNKELNSYIFNTDGTLTDNVPLVTMKNDFSQLLSNKIQNIISNITKVVEETESKETDELELMSFNASVKTTLETLNRFKSFLGNSNTRELTDFSSGEIVNVKTEKGIERAIVRKHLQKDNKYIVETKDNPEIIVDKSALTISDEQLIDEQTHYRNYITSGIENELVSIEELINNKNFNINDINFKIDRLQNFIHFMNEFIKAKNILGVSNQIQKHLYLGEKTLSNQELEILSKRLIELESEAQVLSDKVKQLGQSRDAYNNKAKEIHCKNKVYAIKEIQKAIPDIFNEAGLKGAVELLKDIVLSNDKALDISNDNAKLILENNKLLNQIFDTLYKFLNGKKLVTQELIDNIKKQLNVTNEFNYLVKGETANVSTLESLREVSTSEVSSVLIGARSKYIINLLTQMNAVNLNDVDKLILSKLKDKVNISTEEQKESQKLIVSYLIDGMSVLDMYNTGLTNNIKFKNALSISGAYGSGKTMQVLVESLLLHKSLTKTDLKIAVVSLTEDLLTGTKNSLKFYSSSIDTILTKDLLKDNKIDVSKYDVVVIDESSTLTKEDIINLKNKFASVNTKVIFAGDRTQMIPLNSLDLNRYNVYTGLSTFPLTYTFSNEDPALKIMTNWAVSGLTNGNYSTLQGDIMPRVYHEVVDRISRGVKYSLTETDVINDFLSQTSVDKAIIFLNQEEADKFIASNPGLVGKEDFIYVIDPNKSQTKYKNIQGLRMKNIYIAIDFPNYAKYSQYTDDRLKGNVFYTALSRVSNYGYISMIGITSLKYDKKPTWWIDDIKTDIASVNVLNKEKALETKKLEAIYLDKIIYGDDKVKDIKQNASKGINAEVIKAKENINKEDWYVIPSLNNITCKILSDDVNSNGEVSIQLYDDKGNETDKSLINYNLLEKKENKNIEEVNKDSLSIQINEEEVDISVGDVFFINDGNMVELKSIKLNNTVPVFELTNGKIFNQGEFISYINPKVDKTLESKLNKVFKVSDSNLVFGTNFTYIEGLSKEPITQERKDNKRLFTKFIFDNLNINNLELIYLKEASLADAKFRGSNILAIKFVPNQQELKEYMYKLNKTNKELHDYIVNKFTDANGDILLDDDFLFLTVLMDTFKSTELTNENRITNYNRTEAEIEEEINNGFQTSNPSLNQLNLNTARLRKKGFDLSKKDNLEQVSLGLINLSSNESVKGTVIYGKQEQPISSFIESIQNQTSKSDIKFNTKVLFDSLNGRTRLIVRWDYGQINNSSPWVVANTRKLNTSIVNNYIEEDLLMIEEILKDKITPQVNSIINSLHIIQILNNNKSLFSSEELGVISKYLNVVQGLNSITRINTNYEGIKNSSLLDIYAKGFTGINAEVRMLKAFLINLQSGINKTGKKNNEELEISYLTSKLDERYDYLKFSKDGYDITSDEVKEKVITNAEDIHMPYNFFNINNLVDNENKSNDDTYDAELTREKVIDDRLLNKMLRANLTSSIEESNSIINNILGEELWGKNTLYENELVNKGRKCFGLLKDGSIRLRLQNGGVNNPTIRHEIFHVIWNYYLTEEQKTEIYEEVSEVIGIDNKDHAEEWMANKYGYKHQSDKFESIYTVKGLLQRFMKWLEGVYNRYILQTNKLNDLLEEIESGYYKDKSPIINNHHVTKMSSDETLNEEEHLLEEEYDTESSEIINKKVKKSKKVTYQELNKLLGRNVQSLRNEIAHSFVQQSFYSSLSSVKGNNISDIYSNLLQFYKDNEVDAEYKVNIGSEEYSLNELNFDQAKNIESDSDFKKYLRFQLSKKDVFDAIFFDIVSDTNPETLQRMKTTDAMTWSKQFKPADLISNNLKLILETLPYRNIEAFNGKIKLGRWDNKTFFSKHDIESLINEISDRINKRGLKEKSFLLEFKDEILEYVKQQPITTRRAQVAYNLIARLFDTNVVINDTEKVSFEKYIMQADIRKDKESKLRRDELENILNHFGSLNNSLHLQSGFTAEVKQTKNGEIVTTTNINNTNVASLTNEMSQQMIMHMFGFNDRMYESIMNKFVSKKYKQFIVTSDSLSIILGNNVIKLITTEDGVVQLTDEFKSNALFYILKLKKLFGLNGIAPTTFLNLLKDSEATELRVKQIIPNFKTMAPKNKIGENFIANGLLNMFKATYNNINQTLGIEELRNSDTYKDYFGENAPEMSDAIKELYNQDVKNLNVFNDEIEEYKKTIGIYGEKSSVSDKQKMMDEEASEYDNFVGNDFHKPTDLYTFLNVIADMDLQIRPYDRISMIRRKDNTREFKLIQKNSLSRIMNNPKQVMEDIKTELNDNETQAILTSNLVDDNGELLYPIIGTSSNHKNTMTLEYIKPFKGIEGYKGTLQPTSIDLNKMMLGMFIESVKKSSASKLERLSLSLNTVSDTESLFKAEIIFDNNGTERMFYTVLNNGQIESIKLNDNLINNHVDLEFKRLKRENSLSTRRWKRFSKYLLDTKLFSANEMTDLLSDEKDIFKPGNHLLLYNAFESFQNRLSEENKKAFYQAVLLNLKDGKDYIVSKTKEVDKITGKEKIKTIILPGLALTYQSYIKNSKLNYNRVFNYENSVKWESDKSTSNRDKLFALTYREYTNKLYELKTMLPKDVASLNGVDGGVYYDKNNNLNPLLKGHFFSYMFTNQNIMPLIMNHTTAFSDLSKQTKYLGPTTTPANYANIGESISEDGIELKAKYYIIDDQGYNNDTYIKDEKLGKSIPRNDGGMTSFPIFSRLIIKNFGGETNVPFQGKVYKTLLVDHDYVTDNHHTIKHSSEDITTESYNINLLDRIKLDSMLFSWDQDNIDSFKENDLGEYTFNGRAKFMKYFASTKSIEKASDMLIEDLNKDENKKIIKSNIPWGIAGTTNSKSGTEIVNPFNFEGIYATNDKGEVVTQRLYGREFNTRNLGFVLNPYQDIENTKNVQLMHQILSIIGTGEETNKDNANDIFTAFSLIYDMENANIIEEIGNDFDSWLRTTGLSSINRSKYAGALGEVLSTKTLSLQTNNVRIPLIQIIRNYMTSSLIRQKVNGIRSTQLSGDGILIFEDANGQTRLLNSIEKEFGTIDNLTLTEAKKNGTFGEFKVRDLKTLDITKEGLQEAEVVASYSHFKKYGFLETENINDARFLYYTTKEGDLKKVAHTLIDEKIVEELKTSVINREKTILLRNEDKEVLSLGDYITALETFEDSLNLYLVRVPSSRLGFGIPAKIIGFIQDKGNVIYINPKLTILNDSDFDIDQLQVYYKSASASLKASGISILSDIKELDSYNKLNDYIIEKIKSVYNIENAENILLESSVDAINDIANNSIKVTETEDFNNLTEKEQKKYLKLRDRGFANKSFNLYNTMISQYEMTNSGLRSIDILAKSLSTVSYLMQLKEEQLSSLMPGFKDIVSLSKVKGLKSIPIRIGDYLVLAIDNIKNSSLGKMGVDETTSPIVPILLMLGYNDIQIKLFLNEPIIKSVYADVKEGFNVLESKQEHRILDIINRYLLNIESNTKRIYEREKEYKQSYDKAKIFVTRDTITKQVVINNPNKLYVFGDNIENYESPIGPGKGIKSIRGMENALNIIDSGDLSLMNIEAYKTHVDSRINKVLSRSKEGKIVILHKEELGKSIKETFPLHYKYLNSKFNEMKIALMGEQEEIELDEQDLSNIDDIIKENTELLTTLQDIVSKSEWIRRFGSVVGTRNGLKVNDFEFASTISEIEKMGMSIDDLLDNKEWQSNNHEENFKLSDNEYYRAKLAEERLSSGTTIVRDTYNYNTTEVVKKMIEQQQYVSLASDKTHYVDRNTEGEIEYYYQRSSDYLSTIKGKKITSVKSVAIEVGNMSDEILRKYFNGVSLKYEDYASAFTSKDVFDKYVTYLKSLKEGFELRGEKVYASNIKLKSRELEGEIKGIKSDNIGVAGELDIITVDKKGSFRIYDLKTMTQKSYDNYNNEYESGNAIYESKAKANKDQLNLYDKLLLLNLNVSTVNNFDITKETSGLNILPVIVSYNEQGVISDINDKPIISVKKWTNDESKFYVDRVIKVRPSNIGKGELLTEALIRRERNIYSNGNLVEIARSFPHFMKNISLIRQQRDLEKDYFYMYSDAIKEIEQYHLRRNELQKWDYQNNMINFQKLFAKPINDIYFKQYYSDRTFDLSTKELNIFGQYSSNENILQKLNLSLLSDRELFISKFPEFFITFRDDVKELTDLQIMEKYPEYNFSPDQLNKLRRSDFFSQIETTGFEGTQTLILRNSMEINENTIKKYVDEFRSFPNKIKELMQIYEIIQRDLKFINGSILHVMGVDWMKNYSESIKAFESKLSDKNFRDNIASQLSDIMFNSYRGSNFYSKEKHSTDIYGARPDVVLKKVYLDKKLYQFKHIKKSLDNLYLDTNAVWVNNNQVDTDKVIKKATSFELIKVFSAEEESDMNKDNFIPIIKTFLNGYNYDPKSVYSTKTGVLIKAVPIDNTTVKFVKADVNEESANLLEKIKELNSKFSLDSTDLKFMDGLRLNRENLTMFIQYLQSMVPGLKINIFTTEQMNEHLGRPINTRALVHNGEIYVNSDIVLTTDLVHEIAHLWFKTLRISDKSKYNELVEEAVTMINENHELSEMIKQKFERNNIKYTPGDLVEEIICTVAGLSSEKAVRDFMLNNNNIKFNDSKAINEIWNYIANKRGEIYNALNNTMNKDGILNTEISFAEFKNTNTQKVNC
jgi:hypothetical protein